MSAEQLKFKEEFEIDGQPRINYLRAHYNGKGIFNVSVTAGKIDGIEKVNRFRLDRNQAHLLMLYLQEHLGYNKVEVTEPKMWLCQCGNYHMKDFVCTMLK